MEFATKGTTSFASELRNGMVNLDQPKPVAPACPADATDKFAFEDYKLERRQCADCELVYADFKINGLITS